MFVCLLRCGCSSRRSLPLIYERQPCLCGCAETGNNSACLIQLRTVHAHTWCDLWIIHCKSSFTSSIPNCVSCESKRETCGNNSTLITAFCWVVMSHFAAISIISCSPNTLLSCFTAFSCPLWLELKALNLSTGRPRRIQPQKNPFSRGSQPHLFIAFVYYPPLPIPITSIHPSIHLQRIPNHLV